MVFYFTGTGNSLYVAKALDEAPISIPQAIREERLEFTADRIGIVAPVYGHEVPSMVKDFMRRTVFHTDYFYMVLTYGNRHGGAVELAENLCRECGIHPSYINVLKMVDNWLPSFDMDEQRKLDKQVDVHLAQIAADISGHCRMIAPVTDSDRAAHREFLDNMSKLPPDVWQHLIRVSEGCTGCGICEQVCPSASIRLVGGMAVHVPGNCQTCLACVHSCPHKALGLNLPEKNPDARYRNEHITMWELIKSNHQN